MSAVSYEDFAQTLKFKPTAEQAEVITSDASAMLVIAGAGSGKTTTMSQRIAWKIVSGQVRPDQVLGLTFTRKAAGELAQSAFAEIENAKWQLAGKISIQAKRSEFEAVRSAKENTRVLPQLFTQVSAETGGAVNTDTLPGESEAQLYAQDSEDLRNCKQADNHADLIHAQLKTPTISTYNSFASEIASSYAMLIGENPRSRLITEAERWQIMEEIVSQAPPFEDFAGNEEPGIESTVSAAIALAAAIIDNDVNISSLHSYLEAEIETIEALMDAGALNKKPYRGTEASKGISALRGSIASLRLRSRILSHIEAYFAYKKQHNLIEFADQVSWASKILQAEPEIGEKLRARYKLILLDEYQDTSVNQARFLAEAFKGAESVCAVGDPNQAIYGWRGAGANALADFIKYFGVAPEDKLTLYTSFRNPASVLRVANRITEGFKTEADISRMYAEFGELGMLDRSWVREPIVKSKIDLELPVLKTRENAPEGKVVHVHRRLREDTYSAMAAQIKQDFAELSSADPLHAPTGAVLIRTHAIAEDIAQALKKHGLEAEIFGGVPVITIPEIRAIRALLHLCVSDTRHDCLIYLFNYFALGSADISVFAGCRALIAAEMKKHENGEGKLRKTVSDIGLLQVFEAVEEAVNVAKNRADSGNDAVVRNSEDAESAVLRTLEEKLSAQGYERITYLAAAVRQLRESMLLPLPVLIRKASQLLQLPLLVASRPAGQAKVVGAINIFAQMSEEFTTTGRGGEAADFLAWIDEVEKRERVGQTTPGDDLALIEVAADDAQIPGKIAVLTVHAAKGLQWDIVAIPELQAKKFDDRTARGFEPWHTCSTKLPDSFRNDAEHIPFLSLQDVQFHSIDPLMRKGEAGCRYYDYINRKLAKYNSDEQRRLAYVAFTRPKYSLILGSYEYASVKAVRKLLAKIETQSDKTKEKAQWQPTRFSTFLNELLPVCSAQEESQTPYCMPDPGNEPLLTDESEFIRWAQQFNETEAENDQLSAEVNDVQIYWPRDIDRALIPDQTGEIRISAEKSAEIIAEAMNNLNLLQSENKEKRNAEKEITYFTASGIVALINNPQEFLQNHLRPIPKRPLLSASRGTLVHAQIANYFLVPQKFNIDEIADPEEMKIDLDLLQTDSEVEKLYTRFLKSKFSKMKAIAIEESVELTIAGKPVRCVIDAVFDTAQITGASPITIVDWKSGCRPGDHDLEARQFQLALYKYGWAHSRNVPVEEIDVCFYYLGETDVSKRELRLDPLSFSEMETKIKQGLSLSV